MTNIEQTIKKNTLFQVIIGVVLVFILNKPQKKKAVITVGTVEPLGVDKYIPVYFKESEYFGASGIQKMYEANWLNLVRQLDIIRIGYNKPINIIKGFKLDQLKFNSCQAVIINPSDNDYTRLMEVIEALKNEYKLSVVKVDLLSNKQIYIEI